MLEQGIDPEETSKDRHHRHRFTPGACWRRTATLRVYCNHSFFSFWPFSRPHCSTTSQLPTMSMFFDIDKIDTTMPPPPTSTISHILDLIGPGTSLIDVDNTGMSAETLKCFVQHIIKAGCNNSLKTFCR
jgi:hypothetical protein